jgi:DNA polymerase-3 subunit delta
MPDISYKEFDDHLKQIGETPAENHPQVYLFYGEELLYKKAFTSLIEKLIPAEDRAVNCEPVDGAPDNIRDAVNRVNTYSMLPGSKVIAVQESRIFYGNQDKSKLLDKAKEAFGREDTKKAAKYVLSLMGQLSMGLDDVVKKTDLTPLLKGTDHGDDHDWILHIIDHCRETGLTVPAGDRPDQFLEAAIEKGFPKGNYLALTTDLVDKRRTLFKTIREKGMVVDCSVPKGDRRADRQIQEAVLRGRVEAILDGSKKTLTPPAFARLYEMTGFDLRTFSNNLEKLVLYVGGRDAITPDDVSAVLERSKKDPIYELTGAISDRKAIQSLKLLGSLLNSDLHHLQVFAAIVNQMRKLMLAKAFIRSPQGRSWQPGMPYNAFTAKVLPEMGNYDQELGVLMGRWDEVMNPQAPEETDEKDRRSKTKKKKTGQKLPADLLVAANPKNPYPIYLTLKKADNFSMEKLTSIYADLGSTDIKLKRSGRDPNLVLEEIILKICRK